MEDITKKELEQIKDWYSPIGFQFKMFNQEKILEKKQIIKIIENLKFNSRDLNVCEIILCQELKIKINWTAKGVFIFNSWENITKKLKNYKKLLKKLWKINKYYYQ